VTKPIPGTAQPVLYEPIQFVGEPPETGRSVPTEPVTYTSLEDASGVSKRSSPSTGKVIACPSGHALTWKVGSGTMFSREHVCRDCGVKLPAGEARFSCKLCHFDLCCRCHEARSSQSWTEGDGTVGCQVGLRYRVVENPTLLQSRLEVDSPIVVSLPGQSWIIIRQLQEFRITGVDPPVLRALVSVATDTAGNSFASEPTGWLTCHDSQGISLLDTGPTKPKELVKKVGHGGLALVSAVLGHRVAEVVHDKSGELGEMSSKFLSEKVVVPAKQLVSDQLGEALKANDDGLVTKLLDSALESAVMDSGVTPPMVIRAAHRVAVKELSAAILSRDEKELKGALVMAGRLGASATPEYQEAVRVFREMRKLPPGWEMLAPKPGGLMVGRSPQDERMVNLFQAIFDQTHRKVHTRDRRGQPVPEKLLVHSVVEVQNADKWTDYSIRHEHIRQELSAAGGVALEDVKTNHALPAGHELIGPELDRSVNEVYLFHGTHATSADKIADTSFSINLSGSKAGSLYGRGIYFAENASKSDEYSSPHKTTGSCMMLFCRVLLGRPYTTAEVDPDPRLCEATCIKGDRHALIGDRVKARGTFREFVIFDEDQAYPHFLVTYSRVF